MRVEVAYVAPDAEMLVALEVAEGTTVIDAVRASGVAARAAIVPGPDAFAIFGKRVRPETRLAAGDRVEITRALACDPKSVRRARAARVKTDAT